MLNAWHQLQQLRKHLLYVLSAITPFLLHLGWFLGFFRITISTQMHFSPFSFFLFS